LRLKKIVFNTLIQKIGQSNFLEEAQGKKMHPISQGQTSQEKLEVGKNVFEDQNEYQRIAIQMKDDLSDLKLEEQVDSFCQLLCLTSEQMQKRVDLGSQLLEILQIQFPECSIYPFGLDFIGISSDIDTMNGVVDPFGMSFECILLDSTIFTMSDASAKSM